MLKDLTKPLTALFFLLTITACSPAQPPVESRPMTFKTLDEHLKYILADMIKVVDGVVPMESLSSKPSVYGSGNYFYPKRNILASLRGEAIDTSYLKSFDYHVPHMSYPPFEFNSSMSFDRETPHGLWSSGGFSLRNVSDHPIPLNLKESSLTTGLKFKSVTPSKYFPNSYFRNYEAIGTYHPITVSIAVDKKEPVNGMLQGVGGFSVERK